VTREAKKMVPENEVDEKEKKRGQKELRTIIL
jgi:hypothetical protein